MNDGRLHTIKPGVIIDMAYVEDVGWQDVPNGTLFIVTMRYGTMISFTLPTTHRAPPDEIAESLRKRAIEAGRAQGGGAE